MVVSIVRNAPHLNPFAWLMLFVSVGIFVAMNVASYERFESDEVWTSVGWPFVFWTKFQGTFLVASHTRYEKLFVNIALLAIVTITSVVLAQSYIVQFSIRAILGLTILVALILAIGSVFNAWEIAAVVLYSSPVIILIILTMLRRIERFRVSRRDVP